MSGGPYTHTWNGSISAGYYRRVGRWPGLVTLWDKLLERQGHRLRPPWEWFLYGKRVHVETHYPSVTFSNQETSVGSDGRMVTSLEFTAGFGHLYKSMFATEASEPEGGE